MPLYGVAEQFLVLDGFDIVGFDAREHLGEGPEFVERQRRARLFRLFALGKHRHPDGHGGAGEHAHQQD